MSEQMAPRSLFEQQLIGCSTAISKEQYVETGILSYIKGDIFQVSAIHSRNFALGDSVKAVIYTEDGIINFETSIVAIDEGMIILISPQTLQQLFLRKRKNARIETNRSGFIRVGKKSNADEPVDLEVKIDNISLGGLGFSIPDSANIKDKQISIEFELENTLLLQCELIYERKPGFSHYGAKFVDTSPALLRSLQSSILLNQIQVCLQQKNKYRIQS